MSSILGLRHIHKRKRGRGRSPFPDTKMWKGTLDRAMVGIGLLAPAGLIPQVLQIYQTHDVSSLNLASWVIYGIVNIFWLLYGVIHRAPAVSIAALATGTLNFAIAAAILLFR